jgi:hypothetical protein
MSIDHVYGRIHINEALNTLAMMYNSARVRSTSTIVCDDHDLYWVLPTTFISCLMVTDSKGKEYSKLFYKVENGYIKFDDEDTFTVTFLGRAPAVTLDTETPAINDLYHRTIAKFVAYRELKTIKIKEAEEYKAEFYQEAGTVDLALRKGKKRGYYTPVSRFR